MKLVEDKHLFKDNKNKKLEDEIEILKLQLANLSVNKMRSIIKNK